MAYSRSFILLVVGVFQTFSVVAQGRPEEPLKLTKENYLEWVSQNSAYQEMVTGPRRPESELTSLIVQGTFEAFKTGGTPIPVTGKTPREQLFWVLYYSARDGRMMKEGNSASAIIASHNETLRAFAEVTSNQDLYILENAQEFIYAAMAAGYPAPELLQLADRVKVPFRTKTGASQILSGRDLLTTILRWDIPYIRSGSQYDSIWRYATVLDFSRLPIDPALGNQQQIQDAITPHRFQVARANENSLKAEQDERFEKGILDRIDWDKAIPHKGKLLTPEQQKSIFDAFISSGGRGPNRLLNEMAKNPTAKTIGLSPQAADSFVREATNAMRRTVFDLRPQADQEFRANEAKLLIQSYLTDVEITVDGEVTEQTFLHQHSYRVAEIVEFSVLNNRSPLPPADEDFTKISELVPYFESVIRAEQDHVPALKTHLDVLVKRAAQHLNQSLSPEQIESIRQGQAYIFANRVIDSSYYSTTQLLNRIKKNRRNFALEEELRRLGLLPPQGEHQNFWGDDAWYTWTIFQSENESQSEDPLPKRLKRNTVNTLREWKRVSLADSAEAEAAVAHEIYHRTNILTSEDGDGTQELDIPGLKRALKMFAHKVPSTVEEFQSYLRNKTLMQAHTKGEALIISDPLALEIMQSGYMAFAAHLPKISCRQLARGLNTNLMPTTKSP